MKKREGAAFGFVLGVLLGAVFAGRVWVKAPIDAIHVECFDGIKNDNDQGGLPPLIIDIDDSQDSECLWMPFDFGQGEYDGAGNAYLLQMMSLHLWLCGCKPNVILLYSIP